MMSIPEKTPTGETLRSVRMQPSRRRPVTVVATFLLVAAFVVASAFAATVAPTSINNHIQSDSDGFTVSQCEGRAPGICPF
jgi:hypothetical protein